MTLDIRPLKAHAGIHEYRRARDRRHGIEHDVEHEDAPDAHALSAYHGVGIWGGKGAEMLGLRGEALEEAFVDLLENRDPNTKKRLTARTKKGRRSAYEVTITIPKSLSLYMEFSGDKFFERLPRETVSEIMAELESHVQCRVRKDGADYDRVTGNLIYSTFLHYEARPVDQIEDCSWHVHIIVPNCTYDSEERQWKAVQFGDIKKDAPFFQAAFNNLLAEKLMAHGYAIRLTKDAFELASVDRTLIEKFSRRRAQIKELETATEDELAKKALTWSKKHGVSYEKTLGKMKAELSTETRAKKSTASLKDEELRKNWRQRMTPKELDSLTIDAAKGPSVGFLEAEEAKQLTVESLHDAPSSPRQERELHVAAALLRRGIGKISIAAAKVWAHAVHLVTGSKAPKQATKTSPKQEPPQPLTGSVYAQTILAKMPTMRPGPRFWPSMSQSKAPSYGKTR